MPFVLDCSVTMAWIFSDESSPQTERLRESLIRDSAIVPAIWPIEVGNVLLVATRRGRMKAQDWSSIERDLETLPIEIDMDSCHRVLNSVLPVAHTHNLSVYDAMYLELALRLRLPMATLDTQLARAGQAANIQILGLKD
jgi:predicted nucleic acid-binding protein